MMTQQQLVEYWRGFAFYLLGLLAGESDFPHEVKVELFERYDKTRGILPAVAGDMQDAHESDGTGHTHDKGSK